MTRCVGILSLLVLIRVGFAGVEEVTSVEYLVADSDVIIVGRVVNAEFWRVLPQVRQVDGSMSGLGGPVWQDIAFEKITIEVSDVLKGEAPRTLVAMVPSMDRPNRRGFDRFQPAASWAASGPMILCLTKSARWKQELPCMLSVRWTRYWTSKDEDFEHYSVFPVDQPTANLRRLDFSPIKTADELAAAIRAVVAGPSAPGEQTNPLSGTPMSYPEAYVWVPPWNLDAPALEWVTEMLVPRDHLLAARAREWACSPFATLRLNALIALAQMPSAQSQEMLRQMLATEDDFAWRHPSRWGPRTYPAREHIQRVLREWNAPFDSRPEVEPRVAYAPIRWPWVFGLLIAIAAPLLWQRLRRPATVVLKGYVWVIALLLLAAMWMRSLWFADEFIFNIGRSEHELVSCHGGVQYVWTADWPRRERWRIGSGRLRPKLAREVHEAERLVANAVEFTPWEPRTLAQPWALVNRSNSSATASVPVAAGHPLLQRWGFAFARGDRAHAPLSVDSYPPAQPTASPPPSSTARLIQVPYWMLMSMACIPLGARLVARRRRYQRRRRGLCPQCGYDLRASSVQCPECGSKVGRG